MEIEYFSTTFAQIDLTLSELKRSIYYGRQYMTTLMMQLNMLSLGHLSPSVVTPFNLRFILIDLKDKLPPTLHLTHDPNKELWTYYKFLTCTTVMDNGKIYVMVSLPLLNLNNEFRIYKAHNLPIPLPKEAKGVSNDIRMTARYTLESDYFAINAEQSKFMLLSESDAIRCVSQAFKFCSLRNPQYHVNLNTFCIIALFVGQLNSKLCSTVIDVKAFLPYATYIANGYFAVSTRQNVVFSHVCKHGTLSKSTVIKPPIQLIKLEKFCYAYSDNIVLPAYFHKETNYQIDNILNDFMIHLNVTDIKLWEPVQPILSKIKLDKLPGKLKSLRQIPINDLLNELQSLGNVNVSEPFPNWAMSIIAFVLALVFGIIIFLTCKYRSKFKCLRKSRCHEKVKSTSHNNVHVANHEFKSLLGVPGHDVKPSAPDEMGQEKL